MTSAIYLLLVVVVVALAQKEPPPPPDAAKYDAEFCSKSRVSEMLKGIMDTYGKYQHNIYRVKKSLLT